MVGLGISFLEVFFMAKYEYVNKSEYRPVREELENIIRRTQKILRKNKTGITFRYELIGSGSKHLITRIKGGNKGFDFDYNLILNCKPGYHWLPDYARKNITKAIGEAVKGTRFSNPQNSSVAITIKVKDTKYSRILYSCDFAVIYYPDENSNEHKYVYLDKSNGKYTWEIREYTKDYHIKLDWLKKNVHDYWERIKEEYLKLKDNNKDPNKRSFQLFYETISNIYNKYHNNRISTLFL